MTSIINTNVLSQIAQNNLTTSQASLQTSVTRLSSGLRINSAADDAAGSAISSRLTSQINGLTQARRNANDGISLAQTAGGALTQVTSNLQRIRQLAVQAANSTYSQSDRASMNQEVQQRLQEIDRIASQTQFNGQNLLDGSFGTASFQVGANAGQTINVALNTNIHTNQIGSYTSQTLQVGSTGLTAAGATLSVGGKSFSVGTTTDGSAAGIAQAINSAGAPGVSASATNSQTFAVGNVTNTGGTTNSTYQLSVGSTVIFNSSLAAGASLTSQQIADGINAASATTGVTASLSGGNLTLTNASGADLSVSQSGTAGTGATLAGGLTGAGTGTAALTGGATTSATDTALHGTVTIASASAVSLTTTAATQLGGAVFSNQALTQSTSKLSNEDVTTVQNATNTILSVDSSLSSISGLQSQLGAVQNRFDSTISNLQSTTQNLQSTQSTIQDADYAAEAANLSRAQVLQQAGTAMVAQANQLPQQILKLLQ